MTMTMGNCVQFCQIFLVLMLPVTVAQATVVQNNFRKLESEQNITGTLGAELKSGSYQECSLRCLSNKECKGYQYQETKEATCMLILRSCGAADSQIFQQNDISQIYEKVAGFWNKPPDWSGPEAAFYRSFDTSDGLVSWEGTNQTCNIPHVSGKVNSALTLNHTRKQWVDLGIHTKACMTRPETCTSGGAISVWVRASDCPTVCGIMSTNQPGSTGSSIVLYPSGLGLFVLLQDGQFLSIHSKPSEWTHVVLNYIGPNDGEGIRIYINGTEVGNGTDKHGGPYSAGDGRIVVGRVLTNSDKWYSSVQVDELFFFNRHLSPAEISALATAY